LRVALYIGRDVSVDCKGEPFGDAEPPPHLSVEIDFSNSTGAVTLEGNATLVRDALMQALEAIDDLAEEMVEEGDLDPNWDHDPVPTAPPTDSGSMN
jgi:hypothetical protein